MDINKIKELAEVYLQEQVDLLMRFTSVDSESNYVEGNRQVIDMARAVLETIPGVTMEEMFFEGCGTHLIARIKPEHPEFSYGYCLPCWLCCQIPALCR